MAAGRRQTDERNARRDPTMKFIARKGLFEAVAVQCGISANAVRIWDRVPPNRVRDVEAAIGRSSSLIRPDLFGRKAKKKRLLDEEQAV